MAGPSGNRAFWRALAALLLLALAGQARMFLATGDARHHRAAEAGRDVSIDLANGTASGRMYRTPAPPPPVVVPPMVPVAPPPTVTTPPPAPETTPMATPLPTSPAPTPSSQAKAPPALPVRVPLQPAPNPALTEVANGTLVLPKIGADGQTAAGFYRKPFAPATNHPTIALIVEDLGLHDAHTTEAVTLDEDVTLAWSPYTPRLNQHVAEARNRGHEAWLMLPLQPENYPADDAGPYALLTTESTESNLARLHQSLGSASGYVGLVTSGSNLASGNAVTGLLLDEAQKRGLLLLMHANVSLSPKYDPMTLSVSRRIPDTATPEQTRQALAELEAIARNQGHAIGALSDRPLEMKEVAAWIPTLKAKGIVLAPVSALRPQKAAGQP